jgi:hypothetical protein
MSTQDQNGSPVLANPLTILQRIFNAITNSVKVDAGLQAVPVKIADVPFSSFTANTTNRLRFSGLNRNAQARTFMIVNKLKNAGSGLASNGNVNLVGQDSLFPASSAFTYSGSQSIGTLNYLQVGVSYGSATGTATGTAPPFSSLDTIEVQFPIGAVAPDSGNVEIWVVELR